jgi:hypothetical protein
LTAHKRHGLDCTDYRAKSRSYRYEPNIENARVLLVPTLDQLVAVCLIAPNLENVLQLPRLDYGWSRMKSGLTSDVAFGRDPDSGRALRYR